MSEALKIKLGSLKLDQSYCSCVMFIFDFILNCFYLLLQSKQMENDTCPLIRRKSYLKVKVTRQNSVNYYQPVLTLTNLNNQSMFRRYNN